MEVILKVKYIYKICTESMVYFPSPNHFIGDGVFDCQSFCRIMRNYGNELRNPSNFCQIRNFPIMIEVVLQDDYQMSTHTLKTGLNGF